VALLEYQRVGAVSANESDTTTATSDDVEYETKQDTDASPGFIAQLH